MKVEIISVHNKGNYEEEYVLMRVKESCDIGQYILADSTYIEANRISNKVRHTYWIPDKQVDRGDLVSVWTKIGKNTTTKNNNGETIHRYYWGLNKAVWNNEGDCAVLLELNTWQLFEVE